VIDTDGYSERLRGSAVDPPNRSLLISDLRGTAQEDDLTEPVNIGGYGRIHHFTRETRPGWPANPLPIDPAASALGLQAGSVMMRAQVFQNAVCNWRCWWCYVPFELLSGSPKHSAMLPAGDLVDSYLRLEDRPPVLDLSGGQPDLVPEWVLWTLQALDERDVTDAYVWSDDNLSNDYFWTHLTPRQRQYIAAHPRYGRVACFKGFDPGSFAFNTRAAPELFDRQFMLFRRLAETGMDIYGYATFTAPTPDGIAPKMSGFVDRLQQISEKLPLRVIPLEIEVWGPVGPRMRGRHDMSLAIQQEAIRAWAAELASRFTVAELALPVTAVPLPGRPG
jgi:uncharacterized Fe-S cluster-containing radical SAM superfamily protein